MRKYLILAMIFAMGAVASASFTFDNAQISSLNDLYGLTPTYNPAGYTHDVATGLAGSANPTYSDGSTPMTGSWGYTQSTVVLNNHYVAIGKASLDLSAYTDVQVTLHNDNDDLWGYQLFVIDNTGVVTTSGSWVSLNAAPNVPYTATLSAALSTASGVDYTNSIVGVAITYQGNKGSDNYHTSFTVPAPGAIILAGLGTSLVGLIRRRSL